MGRKVSVSLELNAGQFKAEATVVAGKVDGLDRSVKELDRDITKIPADAAKAAAAMRLIGGDVQGVGNKLGALGDKATSLNLLDAKIRSTRAEVRKLTDEFLKSGDVDVFTKLNKKSGDLNVLSGLRAKLQKEMKGAAEDGAKTFASALQGGIIAAFQALPSEAKAAIAGSLIAVVAAAAPLLGATINAGLLAGVGAGGLAAGIALAAHDPAVTAAWAGVAAGVGAQLKESARPFRAELVETAGIFRGAFHDLGPSLDRIFAKLAPYVSTLAAALANMAQRAMPGIEKAVAAAGPILQAIADNLPVAGAALDQFFKSLAAGGPGAAAGLNMVLLQIEALVIEMGYLFEGLSKAYGAFNKLSLALGSVFYDNLDQPKSFGRRLDGVKTSADGVTGALTDMTSQTNLANTAFSNLFGVMMGVDQANLAVKEGFADLTAAAKDHGTTQDEITGKVLRQIQALQDQRQAQLNTGDGSQAATDRINANYNAQLEALKRMFPWLAALIQKYEDLARPVTKTIHINIIEHVTATNEGVLSSGDLRRRVGSAYAHGGIRKAATGLIIPPSDPGTVLAGEPQTGGELLFPLQGLNQKQALDLLQAPASGYGLDVSPRWRSAGTGAYAPPNVTVSGQDLAPLLRQMERLGDRIERMQVVLDGQRVGAIQGRAADLVRRGG